MSSILRLLDAAVRKMSGAAAPDAWLEKHAEPAMQHLGVLCCKVLPCMHHDPSSSTSGGATQMQLLFSLLSTMLKLSSGALPGWPSTTVSAKSSLVGAMACAAALLRQSAAAASSGTTISSSTSGSSAQPAATQPVDAVDMLPVLFLLGRCFLQLQQVLLADASAAHAASFVHDACSAVLPTVQALQAWLTAPAVVQQLSALGYQPAQLLQSLEQLPLAARQVVPDAGCNFISAPLSIRQRV